MPERPELVRGALEPEIMYLELKSNRKSMLEPARATRELEIIDF